MSTPGPIGTMIERYEVESLLGSGGMGTVYCARHVMLGQRFAIKLLPTFAHDRLAALARFEREARAAASVKHPNVVQVTDLGTTAAGRAFIVMELLEGESLDRILRREAPLSTPRACTLAVQILDGLGAAHAVGVVHRDMKPGNVIVAASAMGSNPNAEYAKILDFGLSKILTDADAPVITETGVVMGTPRYMAPEQLLDARSVDHRADLWAVGVMLFEMLAGTHPFAANGVEELLSAIATRAPRALRDAAPHVSREIGVVVDRALERERERRWQSAAEFSAALRSVRTSADTRRALDGPTMRDPQIGSSKIGRFTITLSSGVPGQGRGAFSIATAVGNPAAPERIDPRVESPALPYTGSAVTPARPSPVPFVQREKPADAVTVPARAAAMAAPPTVADPVLSRARAVPAAVQHVALPPRRRIGMLRVSIGAAVVAIAVVGTVFALRSNDESGNANGGGGAAETGVPGVTTVTPVSQTADAQEPVTEPLPPQTQPSVPGISVTPNAGGGDTVRSASGVQVTLIRSLGEVDRIALDAAIRTVLPGLEACRVATNTHNVTVVVISGPIGGVLSATALNSASSDHAVAQCAARVMRSARGFPAGGGLLRFAIDLPGR